MMHRSLCKNSVKKISVKIWCVSTEFTVFVKPSRISLLQPYVTVNLIYIFYQEWMLCLQANPQPDLLSAIPNPLQCVGVQTVQVAEEGHQEGQSLPQHWRATERQGEGGD